jgi:tetratricopeptide (TPR) repeat protein
MYTIPSQTEWDIIFSKDLSIGANVADYKPADEVLRFKIKPSVLNDKMETFTININNIRNNSCSIDLMWDKTKVSFPVTTEIDSRIEKQIAKELAPGDRKPYYAAANYYFDNGKDLNKALEWATKAADNNTDAYWMSYLKAKIQMKLKDYPGAIKSAELSLAKAREDKNEEYIKFNEKLIADAKKGNGK